MAHIDPRLKEHLAALVASLPKDDEPSFVGTCFFVQVTNSTGTVFDYIITAKHVQKILKMAGDEAAVRINKGRVGQFGLGTIDMPIPTADEAWLFHEDAAVDLAALRMGGKKPGSDVPGEDVLRYFKLFLDRVIATRPPNMAWPPQEGEDVMFMAMTSQFKGVKSNLPIVRKGSIALVTDEPLKGEYGLSQYYVVQAQVYPGNSGSPIWVYHGSKDIVMLGVLTFSYPTDEELKAVFGYDPKVEVYRNYALALVVPIEKVIEMIDQKNEAAFRESKRGPHLPGEAVSADSDEGVEAVMTRMEFEEALRKVSRPGGKEVIE